MFLQYKHILCEVNRLNYISLAKLGPIYLSGNLWKVTVCFCWLQNNQVAGWTWLRLSVWCR